MSTSLHPHPSITLHPGPGPEMHPRSLLGTMASKNGEQRGLLDAKSFWIFLARLLPGIWAQWGMVCPRIPTDLGPWQGPQFPPALFPA